MIQEYLISDKSKQEDIMKYDPSGVCRDIINFENSDCWIVTYSVPHNDEETAKILSEINEYISNNFQATVLSNGSAAYFNKTLFPIINEFERKLRRLLYLKSALNKDEKATENIRDLEQKDLGKIFEILFTDENFTKEVKRKLKSDITWQFAKHELFGILGAIEENTLWDKLVGETSVPMLRDNYLLVKDYRNDVMHAHNINYSSFKDARSLFQKINKQLDTEIGHVVAAAEKQPEQLSSDYNDTLNTALMKQNLLETLSMMAKEMETLKNDLAPTLEIIQAMEKPLIEAARISQATFDAISKINQPSPELKNLLETIDSIKFPSIPQETLDLIHKIDYISLPESGKNDAPTKEDTEEQSEGEEKPNGSHEI